jgi:hypothetical protein
MTDPAPDGITLQATMTKDDYARYFAVMRRHKSSWTTWAFIVGAVFMAIPAALMFRSIGQHFSIASADAILIGTSSLFAFLLGVITVIFAGAIMNHLEIRNYVGETLNAFEPKTFVFDTSGVTAIGHVSQANWRWAAVSQLTVERGLMLVWIGGRTALVIPTRCFASPAARDAAIAFIQARLSEAASNTSSPPA